MLRLTRHTTLAVALISAGLGSLACSSEGDQGNETEAPNEGVSSSGGAQVDGGGGVDPATGGGGIPSASGGAPSPAGGGTGGTPPEGPADGPCQPHPVSAEFTLRFEDEFDSLNADRWELMSHTFDPNLAQFDPGNAEVEDGYLKLHFTEEATGDRDYRGAEVKSVEEFTYGRFETCARWGRGSGLVASFFTFTYGPWNEIDIEYLGGNPVGIQYNVIWGGDPPNYDPEFDPLGYDPADDFHHYAIEWVPGEIRSYIDGELRHTENSTSAQAIVEPSTLRMNIWAAWNGFAGEFDPNIAPTESWYDWVRVYDYSP